MGKKTKMGSSRKDKFYRLAKEQGYRSRAAFKLLQLNKKYNFLKDAKCLIDLCAAPGGWMQVAAKFMPSSSLIIGIDLDPIKSIPNTISMVEDITTAKCRKALKAAMNDWKADVVIHDGSPNVGGTWSKDAYGQSELVLHSAKLACEFLAPGGMFVSKVFRSKDYNSLLWVLKQLFTKVDVTKPEASRSTSAEIYFVCKGYLNPAKIDPEMFKPESVFKETAQQGNSEDMTVNALHKEMLQKKKQRGGYEDGVMLLHKSLSAKEFIETAHPIPLLAEYNQIDFKGESAYLLEDKATNEEVLESCRDLKVLGKREFASLLKWHKILNKNSAASKEEDVPAPVVDDRTEDEILDEKIQNSIEEMKKKEIQRQRRLKKKKREQKFRASQISATAEGLVEDMTAEEGLFSLNQISNEGDLDMVQDGDYPEEVETSDGEFSEGEMDDDELVDEEAERLEDMEETMQNLYEEYRVRKNIQDKKRKDVIASLGLSDDEELDEEIIEEVVDEDHNVSTKKTSVSLQSGNPLERTFIDPSDNTEDPQSFMQRDLFKEAREFIARAQNSQNTAPVMDEGSDSDSDSGDISKHVKKSKKKKAKKEEKADNSFEVVPVEEIAGWSDDSDAEAEVLAIGSAMLRKKKKEELINNSYNRYAFHDRPDELPEWFAADEQEHNRPQIPVTKSEVMAFKAKVREISERPIKKIMESKARKKVKALKRFETQKNKAQAIIDSSDMPDTEKLKRIKSVYSKKQTKKDKVYVVSKRGGGTFGNTATKGKRVIRVDGRMKADKRGLERAEKRKNKKRRH